MVSLFLINKRFVNVDMFYDRITYSQDDTLAENLSDTKTSVEEILEITSNTIETLDLSLISANIVNELTDGDVPKYGVSAAKKALNAYNQSVYKSKNMPSVIIKNFENEQE